MTYKYTTDNKKVVVIEQLNSKETIVQEVFVTSEGEVVAGEKFTASNLSDTPVISWKEAELKRINEAYKKEKESINTQRKGLLKKHRETIQELKSKLNYVGKVLRNVNEASFDMIVDFLTEEINWIVTFERNSYTILPYKEFSIRHENSLRLISLYGKDDGSLTFFINDYPDSSGYKEALYAYKTYEEAVDKLKELIVNSQINEFSLAEAKKFGIELPREVIENYKYKNISYLKALLADTEEKTTSLKKRIKEFEKL